jgi:hypothetical protein
VFALALILNSPDKADRKTSRETGKRNRDNRYGYAVHGAIFI